MLTLDHHVADEAALAAFHDERLREILSQEDELSRGEAATRYINWLDSCRVDASAVRDVAVNKLHGEGLGALRIGNAFGLGKARGAQLIDRAARRTNESSQLVARLKRRLGREK